MSLPLNCPAGSYPTGVDAAGNVEGCASAAVATPLPSSRVGVDPRVVLYLVAALAVLYVIHRCAWALTCDHGADWDDCSDCRH